MRQSWQVVLMLAVLGVLAYVYQDPLRIAGHTLYNQFFPCSEPIAYSVGTFDTRFGISKDRFLQAVKDAEAIWEKPAGKELFNYETKGYLKVNLVYDYRQGTTQTLQKLGGEVDKNKAMYDELKMKYEALTAKYIAAESVFKARSAAFETRRAAYEADVTRANRNRRGVSQEEYDRLQAERASLDAEVIALNQTVADLRTRANEINALADTLNSLVDALNLKVAHYNDVGSSLEGEFTQGLYESEPQRTSITIYQFDGYAKLVRTLAHEMGHALGLEHLDDPKAIMYRLNQATNEVLTKADLAALKARCGIK